MKEICLKAPAKINLYLAVLGKRKDGFHQIETVMQTVSLFDEIKLIEQNSGIKVLSSSSKIPKGPANLVYQAADFFLRKTKIKRGVLIELKKNIPVGAGLGGGSSDAAAVLKGLNKLWGLKLSQKKLLAWAQELGSDVPFFIKGGTAWASGRGEKIKALKIKKNFCFLLFFPGFPLFTAKVYKTFSQLNRQAEPENHKHIKYITREVKQLIFNLKKGDLQLLKENLYNGLEKAVFKLSPDLMAYRRKLYRTGLKPVLVSGSGTTLFTPVKSVTEAENFINKLNFRKGVYIVRSLGGNWKT